MLLALWHVHMQLMMTSSSALLLGPYQQAIHNLFCTLLFPLFLYFVRYLNEVVLSGVNVVPELLSPVLMLPRRHLRAMAKRDDFTAGDGDGDC